jgi:hypothetical protein
LTSKAISGFSTPLTRQWTGASPAAGTMRACNVASSGFVNLERFSHGMAGVRPLFE